MGSLAPASRPCEGHERIPLAEGWELTSTGPGACASPADLGEPAWIPASVPGTVAGALREAGQSHEHESIDGLDWWFRTSFAAGASSPGEVSRLRFGGIATVWEAFLNGRPIAAGDSMFAPTVMDVGDQLRDANELVIVCRALAPLLEERRKPRARWRTRVVGKPNLRFFRTMLMGRAPGFAAGPPAVGPWREIGLQRSAAGTLHDVRLIPVLDGDDGVVTLSAELQGEAPGPIELCAGPRRAAATVDGDRVSASLTIPGVVRWWPHTHGDPVLHDVTVIARVDDGERMLHDAKVGFRVLHSSEDAVTEGLDLHVNGVAVFARGAVWTPVDPVGLAPSDAELRSALEQVRDAGMNMVRIPGVGAYESDAFHDLCDELGILVWQDFMFANLDYPLADEHFRDAVRAEAAGEMARLAGRPSLAVLCGNSEVEQQAAMLGLAPDVVRGELFDEILPGAARDAGADAVYVPSAPCGGDLPFRPDIGIANYYGVGAYRRPLEDARRAGVRFAAECLAFSNVPDQRGVDAVAPDAVADVVVHHPRWKAGVPRDAGTGWDFEDVRDHYLAELHDVDPGELRRTDHARYLQLSRAVTGEVMAEVFGEWRRAGSACNGALVLWLRDIVAGAGWGVIDRSGMPKAAYDHLKRALAPRAVWTCDEGLGGIDVHVANDRPEPLHGQLRVSLYKDFRVLVDEADAEIELAPHSVARRGVEELLGHFRDVSWAYRFGPPAQDLVVATLVVAGEPVSQAFRFPAGRPAAVGKAAELGLEVVAVEGDAGSPELCVDSETLAYGVHVDAPGFVALDNDFSVEPGHGRRIPLRPLVPGTAFEAATVAAVNLDGRVRVSGT